MEERRCYLCAPNPPTGNVKLKDRYYCPECIIDMEEAETIREAFMKLKREGRVPKSSVPAHKQISISPKKKVQYNQ